MAHDLWNQCFDDARLIDKPLQLDSEHFDVLHFLVKELDYMPQFVGISSATNKRRIFSV